MYLGGGYSFLVGLRDSGSKPTGGSILSVDGYWTTFITYLLLCGKLPDGRPAQLRENRNFGTVT